MEALGFLILRVLPYAALAVLAVGCAWRLWGWRATPDPWPQALTPAPAGRGGVWLRQAWRGLALPALWRAQPALATLVGLLHLCLLLVFLHHLRFFIEPVPAWLMALHVPGRLAGLVLPWLLLLLLMRRLADPVLRRLSGWEDYWAPGLLLALSLSGLALHGLERPPLTQVKTLGLGLLSGGEVVLPPPGLFWLHFILALALWVYLPWGKLMHGAGLWLSPGLGRPDQPHLSAPAAPGPSPLADSAAPAEAGQAGQPVGWRPEDYRAALKNRWAGAGVHQVLSARQRAQSLTGQRQWPGPGGGHER